MQTQIQAASYTIHVSRIFWLIAYLLLLTIMLPRRKLISFNLLFNFSDAISENQPRVIDDSRARKLANDLKRCAYYETCATYGLNVERVFQDGN